MGEGRGGGRGRHTWIWIYNGSQQADRVLSSTKMSRVWKWNQESYRTSTSTSSTTHAMATADKFIKCFSRKRDRERERQGERERENPNQRGKRNGNRTWPYRKICPWNSIPFLRFFFYFEGCCIVCVVSLPLFLSFSILFWLSFFFGSCYYWCCLVSLFSFCLLLLQGFSAVLFKYLLTCTERNNWGN